MAKFGIKEVADVTFYDLTTNKPVLIFDSLKLSNLTNIAKASYATGGKGNPRLLSWDFDREATFDMQDALLNPKAFAALTGGAMATGATKIMAKELITGVTGTGGKTKLTLSNAPTDPTPGVGITVWTVKDGQLDTEVIAADYTVTTTDVEVTATDIAVGAQAWVFYAYQSGVTSMTFTIDAKVFPGYYKVVGDTVVRNNVTGVDEPFQLVIYKAKLLPGFLLKLEAQGDPTVLDFKMECYRTSNNSKMIDMIKY